jgi:hypothetical protein
LAEEKACLIKGKVIPRVVMQFENSDDDGHAWCTQQHFRTIVGNL